MTTVNINSGAISPQATIPTEQPSLTAKFVSTFAGTVLRGQDNGSLRPLISVFSTAAATISCQVAPQLSSRG
jgi:hypothetical protein